MRDIKSKLRIIKLIEHINILEETLGDVKEKKSIDLLFLTVFLSVSLTGNLYFYIAFLIK